MMGYGIEELRVRNDVTVIAPTAISFRHAGCPEPLTDLSGLLPVWLPSVVEKEDRKSSQHVS